MFDFQSKKKSGCDFQLLPELLARTSRKPEILLGLSEKRNFTSEVEEQGKSFLRSLGSIFRDRVKPWNKVIHLEHPHFRDALRWTSNTNLRDEEKSWSLGKSQGDHWSSHAGTLKAWMWGVSMKPLLLAGCNTSLKNKWRLWIRKSDHYPEKIRKLDSWSCQPMIGVDWIYYSPFCWLRSHGGSWSNSPFWLVQSPCRWVNVTMFVAYCSHVCFSSQYFGSDPLSRGTLLAIFCRQTIQSCFLGTTCQSPQTKIVLRKGRRCLRWAQNEMRANRRITMNIIQPDARSWCELTIDPAHRNWKNLAINASGAKSTRAGIEPWGFHQNGGYKLYPLVN